MRFNYTANDGQGQRQAGWLDANNSGHAAQLLSSQGLTPLSIAEDHGSPTPSAATPKNLPTALEVQLFSQQMAAMLRAGVPILRALSSSSEGATASGMGQVAMRIKEDLEAGKPLATAMASHKHSFDDYYIAMIRMGEATGTVDAIFSKLYEHLEFQRQMKDQVKAALRYPAIVVSAITVALLIVNFFVIPAFAKVYQGFKAELPIFTRILMGTSSALINYWWIFALVAIGSTIATRTWLATTEGRLTWDFYKLKIPVFGKIAHKATLAKFCQSLSLALSSGLPISAAMALVGETADNAWLASKIAKIKEQIERGDSLYRSCLASGAFNTPTLQMILVGEESGTLDEMLIDIASLYREQVQYELKTIAVQLEPFLLVFMGGLVLVLALGIFLPIWGLSEAAFPK